jgi:hypothetical protein
MLPILIPICWLAIVAFFVILCQAAARGDAAMASATLPHRPTRAPRRGLRLLEREAAEPRPSGAIHLATRPPVRAGTGGGTRPRRPGCVAGS